MAGLRLLTFTVKTPEVPAPVTMLTPVPPICGLLLVAVGAKTTPTVETVAPPLLVTVPPNVAEVPARLAAVGVVTVGAVLGAVVKVPTVL